MMGHPDYIGAYARGWRAELRRRRRRALLKRLALAYWLGAPLLVGGLIAGWSQW